MEFSKSVPTDCFSSRHVIDRVYSGAFLLFRLENSLRGAEFFLVGVSHDKERKKYSKFQEILPLLQRLQDY